MFDLHPVEFYRYRGTTRVSELPDPSIFKVRRQSTIHPFPVGKPSDAN